jgi:hypothetical protein
VLIPTAASKLLSLFAIRFSRNYDFADV